MTDIFPNPPVYTRFRAMSTATSVPPSASIVAMISSVVASMTVKVGFVATYRRFVSALTATP